MSGALQHKDNAKCLGLEMEKQEMEWSCSNKVTEHPGLSALADAQSLFQTD